MVLVGWLLWVQRPFETVFQSISGRLPKRGRERREGIDKSKNVQTTPTRTNCKCSRPLPYYNPNCRAPRHWKFTQHYRTTRPPHASVVKSTVKPVSLTDATTQTDPVTILDSEGSNGKQLSDLSNNQQTPAMQAKQLEAAEKSNTSSHDQCKQASKEKPVLKKATLEMVRKDWQKQQQRERQMNNKPSSPNKTSANTKDKPQKKQTNKPNTSNREQKGSKNELSLQNKFDALSDESEMEFVDSHDHSRNSDKVSWSPILPPSP